MVQHYNEFRRCDQDIGWHHYRSNRWGNLEDVRDHYFRRGKIKMKNPSLCPLLTFAYELRLWKLQEIHDCWLDNTTSFAPTQLPQTFVELEVPHNCTTYMSCGRGRLPVTGGRLRHGGIKQRASVGAFSWFGITRSRTTWHTFVSPPKTRVASPSYCSKPRWGMRHRVHYPPKSGSMFSFVRPLIACPQGDCEHHSGNEWASEWHGPRLTQPLMILTHKPKSPNLLNKTNGKGGTHWWRTRSSHL